MKYIKRNLKRSSFSLWIKRRKDVVTDILFDGDKQEDCHWEYTGREEQRTKTDYWSKKTETYTWREQVQICEKREDKGYENVSNFIFEETFKVVDTYHDYSAGIVLESPGGVRFYYALANVPELFKKIQSGKVVMDPSTGEFSGTFTFRKQGKKVTVYLYEEGK